MGTNDQLETSQRDFIQNYANRDYCFYRAIRERCRDAVSGSARIKAIGGDYTSAYKYLYPSRQQKKNGEEYKRYLNMAVWYGYARIAARVGCGLIGVGEPTVANLPKQIEQMVYYATPFRDGLKALQMRLNLSQFVDGQRIMALELNSPERVRQDNLPVFYINSYQANKFLRAKFDFSDGQSFARFVLMDESDYEFDYFSKREIAVEKYRVFGLDGNDEYYQAAITRDQWQNFDLFSPPIAADSRNPQFGEAIYPELNGIRFNRIPITWCNVSSLSGASYEEPVLTDVADLDIELFNADAAYRQTLWLTSQPTPVINGELTESEKSNFGLGASRFVHFNDSSGNLHFAEFSGTGAGAQRQAIEDLRKMAESQTMSLFSVGGNQSGEALKIIQGSQVAPLVSMVQTSGNAITQQLRYAAAWLQLPADEIEAIKYQPSEGFARLNLATQDILSLINAKLSAPDAVPLLWREIRKKMQESGVADEDISDFDELMEEIQQENLNEEMPG